MLDNYLEFHFFFLPEAINTNGYFVDPMGCKNIKHNIQITPARQYTVDYWLVTLIIPWRTGRYRLLLPISITKECRTPHQCPGKRQKFKI